MRLAQGDLFDQVVECIAITTNGYVTRTGNAVMGRGVAKQAAKRWPILPTVLGTALRAEGNRVSRLTIRSRDVGTGKPVCYLLEGTYQRTAPYDIVSFPVKPAFIISDGSNVVRHMRAEYPKGRKVPGWAAKADIKMIAQSCIELVALADKVGWRTIALPRPGCGSGELDWEEVQPVLEAALDERFVVVSL